MSILTLALVLLTFWNFVPLMDTSYLHTYFHKNKINVLNVLCPNPKYQALIHKTQWEEGLAIEMFIVFSFFPELDFSIA